MLFQYKLYQVSLTEVLQMTEIEEFIYLLNRHPEAFDQLREIARNGALPVAFPAKQNDTNG